MKSVTTKSIIDEIKQAQRELDASRLMLDYCSSEMMECAIYRYKANELRLNALYAIAKRDGDSRVVSKSCVECRNGE